ncbi:ShlB/FhaC/HecB family hemolysin secretion/activation protein [Aetokthonos hydrillicola]|uniref:ShlB/FhaC/HecB family hemolysin secretion/activation protein n=1 Tax=Aetokthonos hydrillicola TaxID=1550245 RepID=UPI001FBBE85D
MLSSFFYCKPLLAQTPNTDKQPELKTSQTQRVPLPSIERQPEPQNPPIAPEKPPVLPPPELLLPSTPPTPRQPQQLPRDFPGTIKVSRFEVFGSSVFSRKKFAEITGNFVNKPITFAELLQVSEAITQLYRDKGYVTSGAFIPANQTFKATGSVVTIQVVEGSLESIHVSGLKHLNPEYVRSRLRIATHKPLNVNKLLKALQLLQLNPLIKNISAELAAGSTPGGSVLDVKVGEAKTLSAQISLDNNRIPSIGSFERQIQFNNASLFGLGDNLSIAYANTDGSNNVNFDYTFPINAHNGTLEFNYNYTDSKVIEKPFDILDIKGTSQDFSLTLRQPISQTPTEEFALGLTASRRVSDVGFLEALVGQRQPFPEPGAINGNTRLAILRFFQDWTKRSNKQVLAARSQFSFGVDAFDATINQKAPDGTFFSWRGQTQWVRLLAPDTLFIARADAQLSDRPLVPLEQFGVGGQRTVRGYRQDLLLTDNAFLASLEFRYPILRIPQINGVLQITPFFDYGVGWNSSGIANPDPNNLASIGLGLLWQSNNLSARFDWGAALVDVKNARNTTLQDDGLYFSLIYTQPF